MSATLVENQVGTLTQLVTFLNELRQRNIFFQLLHDHDDAIMVDIAVPGERWEVEFFVDGHVEVEVFKSDGGVKDDDKELERLFRDFSD